jgi:PKD repeat protein
MQNYTLLKIRLTFCIALAGLGAFSLVTEGDGSLDKRLGYEKLLAGHPYKKGRISGEKEGERKKDRPDLAHRQEVLRTMDPSLGYVPTERLLPIYNLIKSQKNTVLSAGINWTERGPSNVGGRSRVIMFDPNDATKKKVWAGGVGGGLWYCNDITLATPAWTKVNDLWDNIAVTAMAYDPTNTQVFYVGTGEGWYNSDAIRGGGIWKTTDGGATWSRLSSTTGSDFHYIQKLLVHPTTGNVYVATRSNGVMRSLNGGSTWAQVLGTLTGASSNAFCDLEIGADNTIYAAMGIIYSPGGIYSSPTGNSGSWTNITGAGSGFPSGVERIEIATAPSSAGVIYAMPVDETTNDIKGIYRSTNKGASWVAVTAPVDADGGIRPSISRKQGWYDLSMAVDPNDANTFIVGGIDLFRTSNAGSSWTQLSHWYGGFGYPEVHADQHVVVYRPGSSSVALFGNDGGVYYSANINSAVPSFSARNSGYNVTQFYSCAMHPGAGSNNFLAGAQDNGTNKFTASGMNVTTEVVGGDGAFCFIDQDNPAFQIASYVYNNYYLSSDGGNSFFDVLADDNTTGSFINPADYDDRENILYANASSTGIMRVLGVTGSYYRDDFSVSLGSEASHIRVSPYSAAGTSRIFVGTEAGRVFRISNAHSFSPSVTEITGASFPVGTISCIEIGASDNELLVTFSNYGVNSVWYTSNGGSTWSSREGNLPDMPVRWALFNPGNRKEAILATQVGVWTTTDISVSSPVWTAANTGLANVRVDMLQIRSSDKLVIAATHGRGLFSMDYFGNTAPTANFNISNSVVCGGSSTTFTSTSAGGITTYSWNFGSGASPATASTGGPHTVTYSTPGTKTIKLVVTNSNGADSITKTVVVNPDITANTSVTHPACFGSNTGSATVTVSGGTSPYTYLWQGGGTAATKSGLAAGAYRVTVTDGVGCIKTASVNVTQPAAVNASLAITNASCGKSNGQATVNASGGTPGYTYMWSNSSSMGTATALAPGTYSVTVTDSKGCFRTASGMVSNVGLSSASAGSNGAICLGKNITIGGSPTASGGVTPYTYLWAPSQSLSAANVPNPVASPTAATTYTLTVTDAMSCTAGSSVVVDVKPALAPVHTVSEDTADVGSAVFFTSSATGATGWSWAFGDGGTSTSQNPSHIYLAAGTYKITLIVTNGFCSDSLKDSIVVVDPVGIHSVKGYVGLKLYPNPATHSVNIISQGMDVGRVYLLNSIGQVVWLKDNPSSSEKIDLSEFKDGLYFVRFETSKGYFIRSLTIGR